MSYRSWTIPNINQHGIILQFLDKSIEDKDDKVAKDSKSQFEKKKSAIIINASTSDELHQYVQIS